ncbi:MAG: glycosyltransferase family 4 protein [Proteobacteria bacterium]|nr:glycosyltransferase family 4 protein [Pseudomonadota bacterium]
MTRVVMAVNNPGSNDYRVVKSAEVLAAAGYEVIVVGLAGAGHATRETCNGVRYVRVSLPASRLALLPDLVPGGTLWWQRVRAPQRIPDVDSAPVAAATAATDMPARGLRAMFTAWLRHQLRDVRPATSPFSVRLLFARYAHAYLPTLLALEADVYHAHELWMLESCALAARASGARLVYDSHELEPHRNLDWCAASNARRIAYEQRYIADADAVFTVSPGVARALETTYQLPAVGLLRNTPWLAKLRPAARGLRTVLGLDANTPLVVYTGLITRHRGLELMLEALARLPGFHLAMVGRAEPTIAAALQEQAARLGLAARVHALPPVPPEELIDFIASADVAVIAAPDACLSYRYSLPNKLFEALFAGLPLVVSDLEDMRDFVLRHRLGQVFAQGDVAALAAALGDVMSERERYVDEAARQDLCQRLSFEREAAGLLAEYARLAASTRIRELRPKP